MRLWALLVLLFSAGIARPADYWLFASFRDPGTEGVKFLLSEDGDWWEHLAGGRPIDGPWSGGTEPITGPRTEGPSVVKIEEEYLIYYDCYRYWKYFGAVRALDFTEWVGVSDLMGVPPRTKHGSFVRITAQEAERLSALAP